MAKRFVSLYFRHLMTDWLQRHRPALRNTAFVLAAPSHGRMVVTAGNTKAEGFGIKAGMTVADARVLLPSIEILDDNPELPEKLLKTLALWCLRYTPMPTVDPPNGLILDVTGCSHLWGGERPYLKDLITRLRAAGYDVRGAMADTIGTAWAIAHFGQVTPLIEPGGQTAAILPLPPAALRLENTVIERLHKLGLYRIGNIITIPANALRRRFGRQLVLRLEQAIGAVEEPIEPVIPIEPYLERLPCLEPIRYAGGIEIALNRLLEMLCLRLQKEGKGLRSAIFKGYRIDGKLIQIAIGTNRPTHDSNHLYRLFAEKISTLEPDLGIELFTIEAGKVEDASHLQKKIWTDPSDLKDGQLIELVDRVGNKFDAGAIHRYLPDEHYWPERSIKFTSSLTEKQTTDWLDDPLRPFYILAKPEFIQVTAPIPDYPPMNFRYKGVLHEIKKADGPERIEQEWWLEGSLHRDYYAVEDQHGARYWLFRSGHYRADTSAQWFIHGFFA